MAENTKELEGVILNDARLGFLKRAFTKYKGPETIESILIRFAHKYFEVEGGTESIATSWKDFALTEEIKGMNLKSFTKLSANQYSGIMNAIRTVIEKPVYKVKEKYLDLLPTRRLAEMMGCFDSITRSFKTEFPKIIVVSDIFYSGNTPNSHALKKRLAEKAIERLKKYLSNPTLPKSKQLLTLDNTETYIALAGGTSVLRLVNALINELDEDMEFYSNFQKLKPIKIVEMADPSELLTSYGLSENSRTTYLALSEMGLSGEDDYQTYEQTIKKMKAIDLKIIYSGIGKGEDSTPASNTRLQKILRDAGFTRKFLFELNSVPYFDESLDTKKDEEIKLQHFLREKKIIPIEDLKSNYKFVLSGGEDKAKAIYNLVRYSINHPEKKLVTHLITSYATFREIVKLAKTNSNYAQ